MLKKIILKRLYQKDYTKKCSKKLSEKLYRTGRNEWDVAQTGCRIDKKTHRMLTLSEDKFTT